MPLGCCAVVALEIKYKAPKAHTLLELVYVRWGPIAHMVSVFPLIPSLAHHLQERRPHGYSGRAQLPLNPVQ